eukprot:1886929-Prymnesium_polylepis.2
MAAPKCSTAAWYRPSLNAALPCACGGDARGVVRARVGAATAAAYLALVGVHLSERAGEQQREERWS